MDPETDTSPGFEHEGTVYLYTAGNASGWGSFAFLDVEDIEGEEDV